MRSLVLSVGKDLRIGLCPRRRRSSRSPKFSPAVTLDPAQASATHRKPYKVSLPRQQIVRTRPRYWFGSEIFSSAITRHSGFTALVSTKLEQSQLYPTLAMSRIAFVVATHSGNSAIIVCAEQLNSTPFNPVVLR
ncbi:hypothetical protein D8B26_001389 [Coccidioides posadasii str. Silveira]|nr:hypothetical protein D8B26_001389 [Coccidioides posadasii str. Silveira]